MASEQIEKAMQEMIDEYHIHAEKLTRDQLAKCILQAIECGDFIKVVAESIDGPKLGQVGPQAVFYAPYAQCEQLKSRIKFLEDQLLHYKEGYLPPESL